MILARELITWLQTLPPHSLVGVDDGGLSLELVKDSPSDPHVYIEVGGTPDKMEFAAGWLAADATIKDNKPGQDYSQGDTSWDFGWNARLAERGK